MIETVWFRPEAFRRKLLLGEGLSDAEYLQAFYLALGISAEEPVYRNKMGLRLWMGEEAFLSRRKRENKINKRGRGRYMRAVARTIADPDEIWVNAEYITTVDRKRKAVVKRRYVKVWQEAERTLPTLAVFEWGAGGWEMVTGFPATDKDDCSATSTVACVWENLSTPRQNKSRQRHRATGALNSFVGRWTYRPQWALISVSCWTMPALGGRCQGGV